MTFPKTLPWYAFGGIACLLAPPSNYDLSALWAAYSDIQNETTLDDDQEAKAITVLRDIYAATGPDHPWGGGLFEGLMVRFATMPSDIASDEMVLTPTTLYLPAPASPPAPTPKLPTGLPAYICVQAVLGAGDTLAHENNTATVATLNAEAQSAQPQALKIMIRQEAYRAGRTYKPGTYTAEPLFDRDVITTRVRLTSDEVTFQLCLDDPEKSGEKYAKYPCGSIASYDGTGV